MTTAFKKKQISIFMKILFVFLLVFLPLYLISIAVNIMGANSIKNEISKAVSNQTETYLKNLEEEIAHIFEMQGIYINDQDFSKMAYLSGSMQSLERLTYIQNIRNKLNMIKLVSKKVETVKAYFSKNNTTYGDSGTAGNVKREELDDIMSMGKFPFVYKDGRLFLNPWGNSFYKKDQLPMISFVVELSISQLEESLLGFIQYEKGGAVLFNEEQGWMVTKGTFGAGSAEMKKLLDIRPADALKNPIGTAVINNIKYITVRRESGYLNSALLIYMPENELLGPIDDYRKWLWVISILAVMEIVLFSNRLYRLIKKPIINLLSAFRKVDEGMLEISINYEKNDEFRHIYDQFNRMIEKLKLLINQTYEQKILVKTTELKQLQNQINTHFLYNCFFTLSQLIKLEDTHSAGRFTHQLAIYYQFITRNSFELIPLSKEINHAKSYIEIQSFRFSDRILCRVEDMTEGLADFKIPRLILQPLVENCYKHGLKSKESDGKILVKVNEKDGYLYISVEDNGEELSDEQLAELQDLVSAGGKKNIEVTGLLNIHRRITLKYGEDCGLYFFRSDMGGLCAQIKISINVKETSVTGQESA